MTLRAPSYAVPLVKGRTRAQRKRADDRYAEQVRQLVIARDHGCRVRWDRVPGMGWCDGPLQVAHLRGKRRSHTLNEAPAQRHSTAWEVLLCQRHHRMEEAGDLTHEYLTDRGADGRMKWTVATLPGETGDSEAGA